jgi:superoxide dismutase
MVNNTYKFANHFFKTVFAMELGTSTVNLNEAKQLAQFAKTGIEQLKKKINPYLHNQFPHTNFESVVNTLLSGKVPAQTEINSAIKEFYGSAPVIDKQMTPEEWSELPLPKDRGFLSDSLRCPARL